MTKFLNISTDNTLGGNSPSDAVVSSQKAIKTALNAKANSADLATVATSGSYNDLSNKPTIPAAQVNSDWNANSGVARILNKPTLATVATSGSYADLSNKPTIPTVNNATLTIQKNGTTVQTFTANQSTNATANISVPTKTSDITNNSGFITSSALAPYALSANLATVATSGSYTDLSNKPTIPTVDQTYSSTSSNAQSGIAVKSAIDSKLDKLTYEWNNAIDFGSTGKLCIGKFCCYDTNITIDIDATTSTTYHGTLVIALQNIGTSSGGRLVATVYGDATNTIAPNLYIYKHGANDCLVEVYFSPRPWSKNIIHIRAVNLTNLGSVSYDSVAFDLCTSVSGIPATATIQPTNALDSKQATLVSGTNIKTVNGNSLLGSGNITISGSVAWGNVTGTLSNQTDLWSALTNIDCGTM